MVVLTGRVPASNAIGFCRVGDCRTLARGATLDGTTIICSHKDILDLSFETTINATTLMTMGIRCSRVDNP